jgi:endonuclease YncB( thermonuclease family)
MMMRLLLVSLICGGSAACAFAPDDPTGVVVVLDADTLDVGQVRVRLFGIDAPELGQSCSDATGADWPCGQWAAGQVTRLYQGQTAACAAMDTDSYGRVVARCAAQGLDIGAILVGAGIATAYRAYSTDYVAAEAEAKAQHLGIWQGDMQDPAAFRHAERAICAIKGNISAAGRIYHLPGTRSYAATRINETRGEHWFCSQAEAVAAGWRAAQD